jgi:hypothetical protein
MNLFINTQLLYKYIYFLKPLIVIKMVILYLILMLVEHEVNS